MPFVSFVDSFWDQETWMYPGVLLLHPDVAASLLEYRVNRLGGGYRLCGYALR